MQDTKPLSEKPLLLALPAVSDGPQLICWQKAVRMCSVGRTPAALNPLAI